MPIIKSNIHTHTTFCDCSATPEEMVLAAISVGMDTLGFSFHSETPFDMSYCMQNYPVYFAQIQSLKKKYADKICILHGEELDLYGVQCKDCDFIIGSVHYLFKEGKYYPVDYTVQSLKDTVNNVFGGDALAAAEQYFAEVAQLSEKIRPDVYGHFDLITRFNEVCPMFDENDARYKRAALAAVESLPRGAVVEVNLGRLYKGQGGMYPSEWLVRELNARGAKFMLSSDAHCTAALGFAFDETCAKLRSLGVKSLVRYKGKKLVTVEL